MSLVLLSNTSLIEGNQPNGLDRAYNFTNTFQSPMVIPANSEVSLESLKINKDGTFQVSRSNSLFYQYIGTKLTDALTWDLSTRHVGYTRIFPHGEVNADEFAERVEVAQNKAIYHPDLQGLATCEVKQNSSTSFDGYSLKYDKAASASGTNYKPPGDASPDNQQYMVNGDSKSTGWEYDTSANKFNKTSAFGGDRCFAQFAHAPLSCTQGSFRVAFNGAPTIWHVGLSRYCNPEAEYTDSSGNKEVKDFSEPNYFEDWGDTGFYDFVAVKEYDGGLGYFALKLYHAVWTDSEEGGELTMLEVQYYGYTGATYSAPYNLTTNASAFTNIEFVLDGDQVEVYLEKDSSVDRTLVCSPDLGTPGKINYFKPVNMSCAYLYGKMEIIGDEDDHLILHRYEGRNLTGFEYNGINTSLPYSVELKDRLINFDWWNVQLWLGTADIYCKEVDSRKFNIIDDPFIHTFVKTSGGKIAYDVVLILSESQKYKPTRYANTEQVLGFIGASPVDTPTSFNGSQLIFESSSVPKLLSNMSVFVRLNGLSQLTMNGAIGVESNIIYHCPRFDNGGNETGGLYFSPGEKTYIDLRNPAPLHVNSLGIDFVDKRERYVKSIVGESVVCLHIRPKK